MLIERKELEKFVNLLKNTIVVADDPIRSILDYTSFQNFNGTIIALEDTEDFSSLYKISIEEFSKDLIVQIPRNAKEKALLLSYGFAFDSITEYALYDNNIVYIYRNKISNILTDRLMTTDLITKESKKLYEWEIVYHRGNIATGNPAPAIEHSKIHLEDEWILIERHIPSSTVNPLVASAGILNAFKIRYDGTEMHEVTSE